MPCLTDEQLNVFLESGEERTDWTQHLQQCDFCRQRLTNLREERELIDQLRQAVSVEPIGSIDDIHFSVPLAESAAPDAPGSDLPTDSIEGYQILREIHRGGQGVVYLAIQKAAKRKVAVKVMREGPFASARDKARFEREVQILGALRHPHIVAVHDSGRAAGNFYFAMEYIAGPLLDEYVANKKLSIRQILELFAKVCEAVNSAHLLGVIHRDLKPSNIRVDTNDEPHILDFGLAKMGAAHEAEAMTVTGAFLGSPAWASPEQAEGFAGKVDIRTDVYSLGVVLFQILTGKFPYDVLGTVQQVLDRVMHAEPFRPSSFQPGIDDEVETIMLKCLAKERERRYQSAGELARDIRHYLAGEPIEAKRDSTAYLLRKTLRRYRLPLTLLSAFIVLVLTSSLLTLHLWRRAANDRDRAVQAEHAVATERDLALQERQRADRNAADALAEKTLAQERERLARYYLYAAQMNLAQAAFDNGDNNGLLELLNKCRPAAPAEADLRSFEWYHLWSMRDASIRTCTGHTGGVFAVTFSRDGRWMASGSSDRRIIIWNPATGEAVKSIERLAGWIYSVAFAPDASALAVSGADNKPTLYDGRTFEPRHTLEGHKGAVFQVVFSPDGRLLASAGEDKTVRLWDAATAKELHCFRDHQGIAHSVAFSPDGKQLFSGGFDNTIRIYDVPEQRQKDVLDDQMGAIWSVSVSPDGKRLVAASDDKRGYLWDLERPRRKIALVGHTEGLLCAAFAPSGAWVATSGRDTTIRTWNASDGVLKNTLKGHLNIVRSVSIAPGGEMIASASSDDTLKLWKPEQRRIPILYPIHQGKVLSLAISSDGALIASAGDDKQILISKVEKGELRVAQSTLKGHEGAVCAVAFSPDRKTLASGSSDGTARLWDIVENSAPKVLRCEEGPVTAVAFSSDGSKLATVSGTQWFMDFTGVSQKSELSIWDTSTGRRTGRQAYFDGTGMCVRFLPSGDRVIYGGGTPWSDNAWWRRSPVLGIHGSGDLTRWQIEGSGVVFAADFSPDGKTLAVAGGDGLGLPGVVSLWQVGTGARLSRFKGHRGPIICLQISPDGKLLATGSTDETVILWDLFTQQPRATYRSTSGTVWALSFSPDEHMLFAACDRGNIAVWPAIPNEHSPTPATAP